MPAAPTRPRATSVPIPVRKLPLQVATLVLSVATATPTFAQGQSPASSEREGPHSEGRATVRTGSRPVYERGRSVHESSVGKLSGSSVHSTSPSTGDLTLDAMIRQLEGPGLSESESFTEEPVGDAADPAYYEVVQDPERELQGLVRTLREVEPIAVATPAVDPANPPPAGDQPDELKPSRQPTPASPRP